MSNIPTRTLIEAKNLNQKFSVGEKDAHILHDVNLKIPENSYTIIYGPSGSGKSTLLNVLMGLQPPFGGDVMFAGTNMYKLGKDALTLFRAQHIGMVYQTNYWIKSLTVVENVAIPLYFQGYSRLKAHKLAVESLDRVGMAQHSHKKATVLSGGEQQRVSMARALISDPPLIVADEPTGNLDSKTGDQIMAMLQSCQTDLKRTIVLVTHELEYLPMADHLFHIQDGYVTALEGTDIRAATGELMKNMTDRIEELSKVKKNA